MTIYSVNSEILYEAPLTEDALIKYELMGDYYIELPFDAGSYIDIPRGSYIDHEGTRYTVMENILPEPKDEGGYHYAVKFWAGQSFMKNRKLFWLKGANKESSFHITTTIDQFGQLVVDNMNEFMPGKWELSSLLPADALTVTKTISFEGDTCWDAVSSIAEAYGIEWWVHHDEDTMELHFGKLEGGNLVDFKVGEAITSIPSQKGDDSQYGTRFYVYGSNQNLPEGYGDTEQGGTVHHVSNPRLMLPSGIDYIDAKRNMTPAEIIEQVVIFEDVYPKNTDTVTAVTTVQRPIENAAEGQPQTFTAYQLIAANTPFLPSDVMENETLRLVFNSGALTGVEFEVDLRDADDNHIDPFKWKPEDGFIKKFELIAITEQVGETVETLPNESVHPVVGDEFVLLGVRLSDDKVREAEEELLQRGEEWKDEHSKDTSVYNCPTNPVYCKRGLLSFALGQRVRLYDPRFDGGYRDSRIQGFEKRIWNEYIATYTIGDNAAYTRIGAVESSVTNLKTTERTIGMILDELAGTAKELSTMFEMVEYNKTKMIRANYDFFSVGGVTAGGIGSSSGGGTGGGGSSTLAGLNDVSLKSAIANDMLVYNGTHWVNTPMSAIKPDLTAYATKSWVEGKGYITASALDPYAKTADVANTYATQTALQGVDIRVQAIEYIFEKDQDGVINKWSEIVDFLAGVDGTTLDSILEQFATKDSLSGYLPLTLHTNKFINVANGNITVINTAENYVSFHMQHNGISQSAALVYMGKDYNWAVTNAGGSESHKFLLHEGNYTNYTVPKTGGTFSGRLYVQTSDSNGFANEMNGKGTYYIHVPNVASTSGWARGLSLYDDTTSTTRDLIATFGDYRGNKYDYLGGTYDNHILQLRLSDKFSTFYGDVMTYGKFIGNLQGTADKATSVDWTGVANKGRVFDYLGVNIDANQYGSGSNVNGIIYINSAANDNPVTSPEPYEYGAIIQFGSVESNSQFFAGSENILFWRNRWWTSGWSDWKTIAFTDSNVASATKLQTPRSLWGQSFDGTANVDGPATMNGDKKDLYWRCKSPNYDLGFGIGSGNVNRGIYDFTNSSWWIYRDATANTYIPQGYVGIGTTNPQRALHIVSTLNRQMMVESSDYTEASINYQAKNGVRWVVGEGCMQVVDSFGFWNESLNTNAITILKSGFVGVGTLTPTCKLHVKGDSYVSGNAHVASSLFVDNYIYLAESTSKGAIFFGDDEYAYIKETPDDVMTIASNQGLILRVNHLSDEGAVIRMEGPVRIGDAILDWDATNKCITIKNVNTGQKASLVVDGGVTATAIN